VKKICLLLGLGVILLNADSEFLKEDSLFSIYGVQSKKSNANGANSSSGAGVYYDSEFLKLRMENTADYLKAGGVLKFNPNQSEWYIKTGLSYLNEKMYAYDDSTARVNQYGVSLGIGYKLTESLYAEVGGNITDLHGSKIGSIFEISDEKTKRAYAELVKRFRGDFGTLDTSVNVGRTYYEFAKDENFVGAGVNYYPTAYSKASIFHNSEERNHYTQVSLSYQAFEVSYRNLTDNAHHVMVGIKFQCENIFDITSCKIPTNIIPHISENDKFEQITFASAMQIQTSQPNPIGFQCIKPNLEMFVSQPFGMLGSPAVDENGCLESNPAYLNYDYQGQDMFFGQTGNPQNFQNMDWFPN